MFGRLWRATFGRIARKAVEAERRRVLAAIDKEIADWSVEPDREIRETVQDSFRGFRTVITHAGVTLEQAMAAVKRKYPQCFPG